MVDILQSLPPLDIETWNNLPLLSKICFAAAAAGLVLYIVLVIRGRLLGGDPPSETGSRRGASVANFRTRRPAIAHGDRVIFAKCRGTARFLSDLHM